MSEIDLIYIVCKLSVLIIWDRSFCPILNKWLWTTTVAVVTQTHLSRIAQKSLSVLCRENSPPRTRKHWWSHGVLNAILVNYVKGKKKASPEVARWPALERYSDTMNINMWDEFIMRREATSFAHTNTIRYIDSSFCHAMRDIWKQAIWGLEIRQAGKCFIFI